MAAGAVRARLPGRARGAAAGQRRRGRRRARLPPPAHVPARPGDGPGHRRPRRTSPTSCAAMRVVAEVDVELGLSRVVWIGTAQDVGKAINPQAVHGPDRGRHRAGPRARADGGDPDARRADHERELHRLPDPDDARHAAGRRGADRGCRSRTRPTASKGVGEPPTVVSTAAVVSALRAASGRELARVPRLAPTTSPASVKLDRGLPANDDRHRGEDQQRAEHDPRSVSVSSSTITPSAIATTGFTYA